MAFKYLVHNAYVLKYFRFITLSYWTSSALLHAKRVFSLKNRGLYKIIKLFFLISQKAPEKHIGGIRSYQGSKRAKTNLS